VVLVDFWTFGCINCQRTIPHVEALHKKYKDQGFVVIGVHAPEFARERKSENVAKKVKEYGITYPVALDNEFMTWRAYNNRYWPSQYFIDKTGKVRHTHH
jgi:thiol-disulfide isomerase/thioredoxin